MQGLIQDFTSGILLEKSNNLEKSNKTKKNQSHLKNLTSNSVWDSFSYEGSLCPVLCTVNEQIRGYQSYITCYNVVCGPPGLHAELLSPGLEESLLSVSETLDISRMPLLSIYIKTKVVQHDPRISISM